jgi:hypothetical protein
MNLHSDGPFPLKCLIKRVRYDRNPKEYREEYQKIHPGSRRPRLRAVTHFGVQAQPLAVEECAIVWSGCRPTWASDRGPRALPVGLHIK